MITGKTTNTEIFEKVANKLSGAAQANYGKSLQFSLMLQHKIKVNLSEILGEKAQHLSVEIAGGGVVTVITVKPKDNAGKFIWSGTAPHQIVSNKPMPIGQGLFSYRVSHPGTKGKEAEIKQAIRRALFETKVAFGSRRPI
jgi:hypothetical protein